MSQTTVTRTRSPGLATRRPRQSWQPLGTPVPIAEVALRACIIEKHICLSRDIPGPNSACSLEPHEFREMVDAVRVADAALATVSYGVTEKQRASRKFRRSLFVVQDLKAGDVLTPENVRSIRPGDGLPPKFLETVLGGTRVTRDVDRGEPLSWTRLGGTDN